MPAADSVSGLQPHALLVSMHLPTTRRCAGVRYSALLVGAYARRFGHRLVVEAQGGVAMQTREFRYGKVWYLLRAMRRLLSEADERGGGGADRFLMWMDADAVVVHFQVPRTYSPHPDPSRSSSSLALTQTLAPTPEASARTGRRTR